MSNLRVLISLLLTTVPPDTESRDDELPEVNYDFDELPF